MGSHLVDQLVNRGDSVIILDDFSTGRYENVSHHIGNSNVRVIEGSILDTGVTEDSVVEADKVFHLAAAVGVFNIMNHPLQSLTTNIRGSENVFDACVKYNKPVFITSSSEVYGKNSSDLLSENSDRVVGAPQNIRWSYSDAKAIDESMAVALNQQRGLETRIVRLFNTVGPRQVGHYGMVVPRFIESALANKPITIYGDGKQTRCFGHVFDVVRAMILVNDNSDTIGKPINIGSSHEISIYSFAKKVIEITKSSSEIVFIPYSQVYKFGFEDMERRVPDTTQLKNITGWTAKYSIDDIIHDCIKSIQMFST